MRFTTLANEQLAAIDVQVKYLILSLYRFIPPCRNQDWVNVSVTDATHTHFLNTNTWIITTKTGKTITHNKQAHQLNLNEYPEALQAIQTVIQRVKSPWLLPMMTDTSRPLTSNNLTFHMKKLVGFAPSTVRSIYVSTQRDGNASAEQIKHDAKVM